MYFVYEIRTCRCVFCILSHIPLVVYIAKCYMSSSVRLSSVCRLSSVTFVHPTQAIEIFGNVSTPFGTLAICDLSKKILRRS